MRVTRRCVVHGRVQGVFFRATTRDKAVSLGLSGWAKNLPDGGVEVVASGPEPDVQRLCDWLWEGPPMAYVEQVDCADAREIPDTGFSTR